MDVGRYAGAGAGQMRRTSVGGTHLVIPWLTSGLSGSSLVPEAGPSCLQNEDAAELLDVGGGVNGGDGDGAAVGDAGLCCRGGSLDYCGCVNVSSARQSERTFCCIRETGTHGASRQCVSGYVASGARGDGKPCRREGTYTDEAARWLFPIPVLQGEGRWA